MDATSLPRSCREALHRLAAIEQALRAAHSPSEPEILAVLHAIAAQFESGDPQPLVVVALGDVLLNLAHMRGLDEKRLRLQPRLFEVMDQLLPPTSNLGELRHLLQQLSATATRPPTR